MTRHGATMMTVTRIMDAGGGLLLVLFGMLVVVKARQDSACCGK